jgi:hypothetical protein
VSTIKYVISVNSGVFSDVPICKLERKISTFEVGHLSRHIETSLLAMGFHRTLILEEILLVLSRDGVITGLHPTVAETRELKLVCKILRIK